MSRDLFKDAKAFRGIVLGKSHEKIERSPQGIRVVLVSEAANSALQSWEKVLVRGIVKFIPAVA